MHVFDPSGIGRIFIFFSQVEVGGDLFPNSHMINLSCQQTASAHIAAVDSTHQFKSSISSEPRKVICSDECNAVSVSKIYDVDNTRAHDMFICTPNIKRIIG
jgi:hypothetical protein